MSGLENSHPTEHLMMAASIMITTMKTVHWVLVRQKVESMKITYRKSLALSEALQSK